MSKPENRIPNNIPVQVKNLVDVKRKAKAKWQRTHTPQHNTARYRVSNQLVKSKKLKKNKTEHFMNMTLV